MKRLSFEFDIDNFIVIPTIGLCNHYGRGFIAFGWLFWIVEITLWGEE